MASETFNKALKEKEDREYEAMLNRKMQELKQEGYADDEDDDTPTPSKPKSVSAASPNTEEEPGFYKSVGKGLAGGVWSAIGNVTKSAEDLTVWANNKLGGNWQTVEPLAKAADFSKYVGEWYKDEGSQVNKTTHLITENLVGFIPAFKGINALKAGAVATKAGAKVAQVATAAANSSKAAGYAAKGAAIATKGGAAGAVASVTTVTPETETFANLAKGWGIDNDIVNYLAIDDENDTRGEMRLKQSLDSVLFGVVANGAIEGVVKGFKYFKDLKIAQGSKPHEVAEEFQAARQEAQVTGEATIEAEEKTTLKETLKIASPEDKALIKQITSKENPTEEELVKLNTIVQANAEKVSASNALVVAGSSVKEEVKQAAKVNAEEVVDEVAIAGKIDEIKANPEVVEQAFEAAEKNGLVVAEEVKAEIRETIKNADSKQAASTIGKTIKESAGDEVKRSLFSSIFGAGAGGMAGYDTIDEDDSVMEQIFKVTSGAALGSMVARYAKGKLTPKQAQVFEEVNPTISAVAKNEEVLKNTAKAGKPTPDLSNPAVQDEIRNLQHNLATNKYQNLTTKDFEVDGTMQHIRNIETVEDIDKLFLQGAIDLEGTINAAKVGNVGNQATGVRGWKEAEAASKGFVNAKNVDELYDNNYLLDAKMLAGRKFLTAAGLDVKRILLEMQDIVAKAGNTNVRNNADFKVKLIEYTNATEKYAGIHAKTFGNASELGRALNIHKLIIKDEAALKADADNILNSMGGMREILKKADAMRNVNDPAAIAKVLRFSSMPLLDAAFFMRTAGMLSSPFTHGVNIVGNITKQAVGTIENYTKAGYASINNDWFKATNKVNYSKADADAYFFGLAHGLRDAKDYLSGSIVESFNSVVRKIPKQEKEAGVDFYNTVAGTKSWNVTDAATSAGDAGLTKINPIGTLGKSLGASIANSGFGESLTNTVRSRLGKELDPEGNLELAGQWIGSVIGVPFRFLASADKTFNALSHRASLSEQAFRKAKAENLTGDAFNKRVASLIEEPTKDMAVMAEKRALDDTFQTPLDKATGKSVVDEFANLIQNAKMTSRNPVVNFMANLHFPFVKTPTNILKQSLIRTPVLNLLAERYEENSIKAAFGYLGKEKQAEATARFVTGMVMLGAGYGLHENGGIKIVNNGRNVVIDWGDRTTDLAKVEPIGTILGLSAKVKEALEKTAALREVDPEAANNIVYDVASTALLTIYQYTGNKSYLKGFFDLTQVGSKTLTGSSQESADALETWIENNASSFMPYGSLLNYGRNLEDDNMRVANDTIDKIMNKIPLLPGFNSKLLEPKLDMITGDALQSDSTTGAFKKDVQNPLLDELRRLEISRPYKKKIGGIELTEKSLTRYIEIATKESEIDGMNLQDYLKTYMESSEYQEMEDGIGEYANADGTKSGIVNDIITAFYADAEAKFIEENEKLQDDIKLKDAKQHSYMTGEEFIQSTQEE